VGGEEFLMILPGAAGLEEAMQVLERTGGDRWQRLVGDERWPARHCIDWRLGRRTRRSKASSTGPITASTWPRSLAATGSQLRPIGCPYDDKYAT